VKSLALFPDENPNPILRVWQDGTLLYANQAAQARFPDFGYQIDKRVPAFLDTIVKETFAARGQRMVEIQKDGKTWSFSLVPIQGKDYMNVYCTDITERKQAEEALRESEARYRNIFENSPVGIFQSTPQGRYLQMNPCLAVMFGYDSNEEAIASITDIAKQVYVNSVKRKEFTRQLEEQGQVSEFVNQNCRKDGSLIWTSTDARVVKDQDGNIQYYEGFMRDISEQKQNEDLKQHYADELEKRVEARTRELHAAQEQLVRKEKLATLGQMAGSVGHELRNPLGVINTSIYYLKMVLPEASEKIKQHMDIIEKQVHISDKIISDLLNFSREVSSEPKAVSIKELVQRTLVRFPPPRTVELRLDLPEDLPEVYADPQHMEQVLGNLVMNACQAMPGGGKLSVTSDQCNLDGRQLVWIKVRDTGTGIPPENMKKLFEPLFTTKPRGIGLGLAVSQKLIEANGGRIEVESEVGKGSTFTMVLAVKPINV
jgi:PAS domain S-box-containing protein